MEDRPPLDKSNKIYTLTPRFITNFIAYYRKIRLKRYKHKKIKEAKTTFDRNYFIKFKLKLNDSLNPQISDFEYETVIPAKAIYFAKLFLERDIKNKISIDVTSWEEMSEEEHEEFQNSIKEHIESKGN